MNKVTKLIFKTAVFLAIVGLALYAANLARENQSVRDLVASYGYIGIFLISVISGFNFVVPIPAISFLPLFLESGQDFWVTIFLITGGMSVADIAAYFLGGIGKEVMASSGSRIAEKLEGWRHKFKYAPLVALFVFASLAPLPNELLLVPLAFFGYRSIQILPIVFAGNFIFNLLYASGFTGLVNIFS